MEKKYRANLDPSLKLQEHELKMVWVKLERTRKDPTSPHKLLTESMVQCFHQGEWSMLQRARAGNPKGPNKFTLNWPTIAGWHEFQIMHDPSLMKDIKELEIT